MSAAALYPPPPSRYLPPEYRPAAWPDIRQYAEELAQRTLPSAGALEGWLLDRSELDARVAAEGARRSLASACHTDDAEAERRHLQFQMEVVPEVKSAGDRLDRKFLGCERRTGLDARRWQVYVRHAELDVRLFRPENVPLEAEEDRLCVEYGAVAGRMTVQFRGSTHTLQMLARYLEEPERGLREEAWRLGAGRRLQDRATLDRLFDELRGLRQRIAGNAGFGNYRDYRHTAYGRFDYTPEDCLVLHENVRRHVLPLWSRMCERRRRLLGLERLRPWDLLVDPELGPPFQPFQDQDGQVRITAGILDAVDPEFGRDLRWMEARGLLDLQSRPNKRPGGFLEHFEDERVPFIFANSPTTHDGVETLLHESGHAQHLLRCRSEDLLDYRSAPIEFAEVASMAMEALGLEHLAAVYPAEEARRARAASLEGIVRSLPWMALVDAFQHWIYLNPDHAPEQRRSQWTALAERFLPGVDWSGLETERANEWQRQIHLFEVPFYYIEYAIAQIGALQVWRSYRHDPRETVRRYKAGLALGGSRPLPELYAAAGLRFDPRGELLPELMAELEGAWNLNLPAAAR